MKNEIEFADRVSSMYCKNNSSYFLDLTAMTSIIVKLFKEVFSFVNAMQKKLRNKII
jgi:hypothetical protein